MVMIGWIPAVIVAVGCSSCIHQCKLSPVLREVIQTLDNLDCLFTGPYQPSLRCQTSLRVLHVLPDGSARQVGNTYQLKCGMRPFAFGM